MELNNNGSNFRGKEEMGSVAIHSQVQRIKQESEQIIDRCCSSSNIFPKSFEQFLLHIFVYTYRYNGMLIGLFKTQVTGNGISISMAMGRIHVIVRLSCNCRIHEDDQPKSFYKS
ncbi:hypothetical protein V6N13_035345 [Hibiscus sabdariffa]